MSKQTSNISKGHGRGKMHVEKAKDSKKTMKRLWKYLEKYKLRLILVIVFIVLYVILNAATTFMLSPIINDYITPIIQDGGEVYVNGLKKMLLILMSIAIGAGLSSFIQARIMINIGQNTVKQIRKDLFEKIEKLPIKYFDTHKHGELMSRITNDMDNIGMTLNTSVNQVISGILSLIVTLISMIIISPMLTLITLITIPVMLIVVSKISKITRKQFVKQQESLGELNGYIEEYISGTRVVKAFNKEEDVKENFQEVNLKYRKEGFKAQAYAAIVMPIMGGVNNISTAIIAVISGGLAIAGRISIGQITSFNKFAQQFSQPINEISQQFNVIQAGLAGAERCFEIIDEQEEYPDNIGKPEIGKVKGLVELKNVSFEYEENKPVLKNVNLVAKPGQTVAIVGPTGAGKTTIINLLTRFYDVKEGEILIDGKNIKDVNKYSLREALGIVLQDTVLFSETVRENIQFGNLNASQIQIEEASKVSNAYSFINQLPERFDTLLSEDAGNISIGQRQLLNIARVVLKDPEILILDEATSNVDTRTEKKIVEAMHKLLEGRTSFVIAHRLSTVRNADKILVVNDGQIIEQGTHNELINQHGMYYNMYSGMFDNIDE